jgi:hypothetical protein
MRARIAFAFGLLAASFAGCYNPQLPDKPFYCNKTLPDCPAGYDCDLNHCGGAGGKCDCLKVCATDDDCIFSNGSSTCDSNSGFCTPVKP